METLRDLYERIPEKLRKLIVSVLLPFLIGLIITLIWGVETLLVILFLLFCLSYLLFKLFGSTWVRESGEWSITQFFKRIRWMLIFALLPAVWELIRNFSLESIIAVLFIVIIALTIWKRFDELISSVVRDYFRPGKRGHRPRR
jgi:hypothetical protein